MEKAKAIIASFLKIDSSEVNIHTRMDNKAIPGSVLIHRMYSELANAGYHVKHPKNIKTFGDFLKELNDKTSSVEKKSSDLLSEQSTHQNDVAESFSRIQIGIDIEEIENMPETTDYREHKFYINNFSKKEISYCLLQPNPRVSFAGRFACKEAIVKADNRYKSIPFSKLEILPDANGKPVYKNFNLSISHTKRYTVAVAIKDSNQLTETYYNDKHDESLDVYKNQIQSILEEITTIKKKMSSRINYITLFISLGAIVLSLVSLFYKNY